MWMTLGLVGVLICWKAGRFCRETWTLHQWAEDDFMRLNKAKGQVLPLGHNSHLCTTGWGRSSLRADKHKGTWGCWLTAGSI